MQQLSILTSLCKMLLFAKIKVVPESPLCWVDLPSVQILQAPPSCPAPSPDYRSSHICPWCCVWPKHHHCCLEQSRQFNISQISTASGSVYPTISIFHGGTINVMLTTWPNIVSKQIQVQWNWWGYLEHKVKFVVISSGRSLKNHDLAGFMNIFPDFDI